MRSTGLLYMFAKSGPVTEINGTSALFAMALAMSVFPVPDGPESNTPRGIFAPKRV